jgi:radical SAM superfamily enzyme YgiQ (UPF0313 family)
MDITLINPPEKLRVWAGIPKAHAHGVYCFPPLGLMYIQAAVEKRSGYKAEICDPVVDDLDYPDFEQMLRRYPLDLVGISTYTHSLPDVQMTIDLVRKVNPNAKIVLGGPHCAMFPDYSIQLKGIDGMVTGDGEDAFLDLAKRFDAGKDWSGIAGLWWMDTTARSSRTPSGRPPRTSPPTPGPTAPDRASRTTTCRAPSSPWSPRPSRAAAVRTAAPSASPTRSSTASARSTTSSTRWNTA